MSIVLRHWIIAGCFAALLVAASGRAEDAQPITTPNPSVDLSSLRTAIARIDDRARQVPALSQTQRNHVHIAVSDMRASLSALQVKLPSIATSETEAYRLAILDLTEFANSASQESDPDRLLGAVDDLRDDLATKAAKRQSSGAYPSNSVLVRVTVNTVNTANRAVQGYNIGLSPMRWSNEGYRVTFDGVTNDANGMVVPGLYRFTAFRGRNVGGVSDKIRVGANGEIRKTVAIIVQ